MQDVIQSEMGGFQDRLQRCTHVCQDEVTDFLAAQGRETPSVVLRANKMASKCIDSCVDKHLRTLATTEERIFAAINSRNDDL